MMSNFGQTRRRENDPEADLLVRTYGVTHPPSVSIPRQTLTWDQLAHAAHGVMNVITDDGVWVVPPHRAVWVPAGVTHRIEMSGRVTVRTLFFAPGFASGISGECRAINVPALLRELILHTVNIGLLHRSNPVERRLALVILDQLETMDRVPLQLPMPVDQRALRAAAALRQDPTLDLDRVARESGASRRTLQRRFKQETGMTLGRWRTRALLVQSLRLLAEGHSVTTVALEVGYATASAFVAAFKRDLGVSPARYFTETTALDMDNP